MGKDHRGHSELALTDWDPASKQPIFKTAAAAAERVAPGGAPPPPAPMDTVHERTDTADVGGT